MARSPALRTASSTDRTSAPKSPPSAPALRPVPLPPLASKYPQSVPRKNASSSRQILLLQVQDFAAKLTLALAQNTRGRSRYRRWPRPAGGTTQDGGIFEDRGEAATADHRRDPSGTGREDQLGMQKLRHLCGTCTRN